MTTHDEHMNVQATAARKGGGDHLALLDLLVVRGVSKRFGPTQALSNVDASFRAGEVHALMGENGAGKSTLGKTIAGLHKQDEGTITIDGVVIPPGSLKDALRAGVRIVHQELAQCPNLSVAENLCLHDLPRRGAGWLGGGGGGWVGGGLVDFPAMARRAERLLGSLEPSIDVEAPLASLSPGHRQIVQIASALDEGEEADGVSVGSKPRVIVFDEPTSSLAVAEVDRLLAIVRQLAQRGLSVLYVSHRMGEIFEVCDRVTVLRDGKFIGTSVIKDIQEADLVEQMIGRRLEPGTHARKAQVTVSSGNTPVSKPALEVRGLSTPGRLSDISFSLAPGEILGVGGLVGAGRSELLDAIFGLTPEAEGEVEVFGEAIPAGQPRAAIAAGIGYVPEDRKLQGLFFQLGLDENIVVPFMSRLARALGLRSLADEGSLVRERMTSFRVKAASPASLPGELSGGNQQKLLIARWMGPSTRVLLLDEPTRGIDVGTKTEIHRLVREAADAGAAVLVVSSEMPELLALSDRVIVLSEGRLSGELRGDEMTQTNILRLATAGQMKKPAMVAG